MTPVPKGSKAKKAKDKKETKTKEFMHKFHATPEAYLLLLTTSLSKHSQDKYKVTEEFEGQWEWICEHGVRR